jgi:hypothetical protein
MRAWRSEASMAQQRYAIPGEPNTGRASEEPQAVSGSGLTRTAALAVRLKGPKGDPDSEVTKAGATGGSNPRSSPR